MADETLILGVQVSPVIVQPVTTLPDDLQALRDEARGEGFDHIDVLWTEWQTGANRFARPGELLVAATVAGELAGIGGVTEDFLDRGGLRMRRFYVRPAFRRSGVARALASRVLEHALPLQRPIWLFAAGPEAVRFWEAMGFVPTEREKTTHVWPSACFLR